MIKQIHIKNFQSHRNTILDFAPGINGIIGESQSGKTAILRAIKLITTFRPLGFRFHSHFSKTSRTSVSMTLGEGDKISLVKKKNSILFSTDDINWRKPGVQVPDVIKEKLNMDDINTQEQSEPPFLISSSPAEIARAFSQITGTEQLGEWIKNINKKAGEIKTKRRLLQGEVDRIEYKTKELVGLEDIDRLLTRGERIEKKIIDLRKEYSRIDGILAEIVDLQASITQKEEWIENKEILAEIEMGQLAIQELQNEMGAIKEAKQIETHLSEREIELEGLVKIYIKQLKKEKKCPTCFSLLTPKSIRKVKDEINIIIRHPHHNEDFHR